MPTESILSNLQLDRLVLQRQAAELMAEIQEAKVKRQALEKEREEAQIRLHARIASGDGDEVKNATNRLAAIEQELLAVEERLQLTNSRVQQFHRDSALVTAEINRTQASAASSAERIKQLRHDLFLMQRKPNPDLPVVINAIRSIRADLQASTQRYIGLVGEDLPDEAA
jgi:chromosome segregation ATPase